MDVLHCKTPLIFGACVELHLLFGTFKVLYCKTPLLFGACVELHLSFDAANVLHCKKLLYLALVLNYVFNCQCGCAAL